MSQDPALPPNMVGFPARPQSQPQIQGIPGRPGSATQALRTPVNVHAQVPGAQIPGAAPQDLIQRAGSAHQQPLTMTGAIGQAPQAAFQVPRAAAASPAAVGAPGLMAGQPGLVRPQQPMMPGAAGVAHPSAPAPPRSDGQAPPQPPPQLSGPQSAMQSIGAGMMRPPSVSAVQPGAIPVAGPPQPQPGMAVQRPLSMYVSLLYHRFYN
jgi:hypothetical protein